MTQKITIEPVTRIEGHAKVTIHMKKDGTVGRAYMHVNEFRGFEKFCEGRLYFEMPQITPRICGICPVSHHLAANYRLTIRGDRAEIWAHGYAWNRVPALPPGADLWETWGDYRLTCRRVGGAWRLDGFRYYSKLTRGNDAVRTHTQDE